MSRGFTLTELLIVISIFAFFASVGILIVQDKNARIADDNRISQTEELSKLADEYFEDSKTYEGICKSKVFVEVIRENGGELVCDDIDTSWAIYFKLRNDPFDLWCSNNIEEVGIRVRREGLTVDTSVTDCIEGGEFWE